jgi:hypothetical protein
MYDYYRVSTTSDVIPSLLGNTRLDFSSKMHYGTGEVEPTKTAMHKGQTINIYGSGNVSISGSIHKYFNDGKNNHTRFTYPQFEEALDKFHFELGVDPSKTQVHNIEVGVNLQQLSASTSTILDGCIRCGKNRFKNVQVSWGNYRQCKFSQFSLKAYDKAMQYRLHEEVFRWEMKYCKSTRISKTESYSLSDFTNPTICKRLGEELKEQWERILFLDPRLLDALKGKRLVDALNWSRNRYWDKLGELSKSTRHNAYYREIERFKDFANYHSRLQSEIAFRIENEVGSFYTNSIR